MRESTSLIQFLDLADWPTGLWLCHRRFIAESLEDLERGLDEFQEILELRGITYPLLWDFVEAYGNAGCWAREAVKFLDSCCTTVWFLEARPRECMYVFGCVYNFCRLSVLVDTFLDSVTGMLGASQAGTGSRVLPSGTAVLFAELVADFQEGEWIEEIGRKQPHKALWFADSMNPWNRRN